MVASTSRSSCGRVRSRWSASSQPSSSPESARQRRVRAHAARPRRGGRHRGRWPARGRHPARRRGRARGRARRAPPGSGRPPSGSPDRAAPGRRPRSAPGTRRRRARPGRCCRRRRASPCGRAARSRAPPGTSSADGPGDVGLHELRADRPRCPPCDSGTSASGPTASIAAEISSSTGGTIWAPSAEVQLVAVVRRRVVAGGDHDPRGRAQVADREGEDGGRERVHEVGRPRSRRRPARRRRRRRTRRCRGGRRGRPRPGPAAPAALQPRGHARGGPAHQRAVHAVGPGPERTAQTGGAELQARRRSGRAGRRGRGRRRRRVDLGPGDGVGVLVPPGPRPRQEHVVGPGRGGHAPAATAASTPASDAAAPAPGLQHVDVVERRRAHAGGEVRDERQAEHLGARGGGRRSPRGTVDMPTRSAPSPRSIRISAGVSYCGPATPA